MRKTFFASLLFSIFLVSAAITAEENPQKTLGLSFNIEPLFGMRFGKEDEIVWVENTKTKEIYKLSELEWEYKPEWYIGSNFLFNYKRFEVSVLSKFYLATNCGIMKDSDWQQDFIYKTGDASTKTNYSESDNKIKNGHDIELLFAVKLYPTNFITLRPRLSFNYQRMNFSATGGTLWYGNDINGKSPYENGFKGSYYSYDSEESIKANLKDTTVIEYDTRNLYLWTGLQVDFIPTKKIVISLASEIAPILFILSYDSHVLRKIEYKQYSLSLFYAFRQSGSIDFHVDSCLSFSLKCSAVFTLETSGPSFAKMQSSDSYNRDGDAGGYSKYIDFGASVKFSW